MPHTFALFANVWAAVKHGTRKEFAAVMKGASIETWNLRKESHSSAKYADEWGTRPQRAELHVRQIA